LPSSISQPQQAAAALQRAQPARTDASYAQLPDAVLADIITGDCIAFRVMELVVGFKECTRPRGGVAIAFEPCVTGWKEAVVLDNAHGAAAGPAGQLRLKITGGYDQFAGHEAWQMDMVEADAPDEATRWRLHTEVAASWAELQNPKLISRIRNSSTATNTAAAKPDAAPPVSNRGARRAASRSQPAPAAVDGGCTGAVAAATPAAVSSTHAAGASDASSRAVGQDAPTVQSFGIGLPPRPKRNASK